MNFAYRFISAWADNLVSCRAHDNLPIRRKGNRGGARERHLPQAGIANTIDGGRAAADADSGDMREGRATVWRSVFPNCQRKSLSRVAAIGCARDRIHNISSTNVRATVSGRLVPLARRRSRCAGEGQSRLHRGDNHSGKSMRMDGRNAATA